MKGKQALPRVGAVGAKENNNADTSVFAARQKWTSENLPPLEYLSLSFSAFLCIMILANYLLGMDAYHVCTIMSRGAMFYFTADSFLEVFVLNRFKYIFHHAVALGLFLIIARVEQLGYSRAECEANMYVAACRLLLGCATYRMESELMSG